MSEDGLRAPDELHGDRFAVVPARLLAEKADVVKLYAILDRYAGRDRHLWPGQAELALKMECSDRHVRRLLGRLQEVGALTEVKRRYNGSTVYRLCATGLVSPLRPDRGVRSEPTDRTGESAPSGPGSPPNERNEREPQKIARAIPADYAVTPAQRAWAADRLPALDVDAETEAFKDHHAAKGSTFKDWDAAWRGWMRRSVTFNPSGANGHRPEPPKPKLGFGSPMRWQEDASGRAVPVEEMG